jgi:hypothetical protein
MLTWPGAIVLVLAVVGLIVLWEATVEGGE